MPRTVQTVLGAVQRKCQGRFRVDQIYEAFLRAHRDIYANYKWPWTVASANIGCNAPYQTGTVSINDGTAALTGVLTVWDVAWRYKKIIFGTNTEYRILSFGGVGAATLAQNINTGQNWVNVPYTIFQDLYPLPDDCEPGNIISIVNPTIRYRLFHPSVYAQQQWNTSLGVRFNNFQETWSEGGYDEVTHKFLIRMLPPPGSTTEYLMFYRRKVPEITALTDYTQIPETFDQVLEDLTEANVKRVNNDPTWIDAHRLGYGQLAKMRRRAETEIDDIFTPYSSWPYAKSDVTMFDPMTGTFLAGPTSP